MKRRGALGAILLALSAVFASLISKAFLGPSFAEYPARLSREGRFEESPWKENFRTQWAAYLELPSPMLPAEGVRLSGKTDAEGGFSLALPWPGFFARGKLRSFPLPPFPHPLLAFPSFPEFRAANSPGNRELSLGGFGLSSRRGRAFHGFFLLQTKRISSLGKSSLRKRKSPGIRPGPSDGRTSGVSLLRNRTRREPRSTFPFPGAGSGKSGSIGDAGCGSLSSFPSPPQTPWIGQNPGFFPRRKPKKP